MEFALISDLLENQDPFLSSFSHLEWKCLSNGCYTYCVSEAGNFSGFTGSQVEENFPQNES